jgi:hypothetical protein
MQQTKPSIYNIVLAVYFAIIAISCTKVADKCSLALMYRGDEFKARVAKKWINYANHAEKEINFDSEMRLRYAGNPMGRVYISAALITEGFWHYVAVGDSVIKKANSNTYTVRRVNHRDSIFRLYYDCDDTLSVVKVYRELTE